MKELHGKIHGKFLLALLTVSLLTGFRPALALAAQEDGAPAPPRGRGSGDAVSGPPIPRA